MGLLGVHRGRRACRSVLACGLLCSLRLLSAEGAVQAVLDGGFFGHPQGGVSVNGQELLPSTITDLVVLANGKIVVCGSTNTRNALPQAKQFHLLLDEAVGTNMAFVAQFSADLKTAEWLSLFPFDCIVPRKIMRCPDGTFVLGARRMERLLEWVPEDQQGRWKDNQAVLIKLSPEGREIRWVHPGAPNQIDVTGLAVDAQGVIYWSGGTLGPEQPALVCRVDPDGQRLLPWAGRPDADIQWALNLHGTSPDLNQTGQFWHFYRRAQTQPYDYDGRRGSAAETVIDPEGLRQGGPLLLLPDGDLIIGATFQYRYHETGGRRHGGRDLFLARYDRDGRLKWSTNLYRRGDGIHGLEQRLVDLAYDPASGALFVLAHQHGTARYKLLGDLVGNPGNSVLSWVGRVDARSGGLTHGWYFQNPRPDSPDGWPQLSSNALTDLELDDAGQVYLTGGGGAATVTTKGALQSWPREQKGAEHGVLVVLDNTLQRMRFASLIRGTAEADLQRWPACEFHALGLNQHGVILGGTTQTDRLPLRHTAGWSAFEGERSRGAFLGLLRFETSRQRTLPVTALPESSGDVTADNAAPPLATSAPPGFRPY
ncbi:MAG: hypothetical protein ACFBZ8_07985 [Opitutales bacterium]